MDNTPALTPTAGIFAFLDYDTTTGAFRLYDGNTSFLGGTDGTPGINGIAFDFSTGLTPLLPSSISSFTTIYDNTTIGSLSTTTSPNAAFDVAYSTGSDSAISKVGDGESTSFAISNFSNIVLTGGVTQANSIAIRVGQAATGPGNGANSSSEVWFRASSVSVVPEAETYPMFLAGLGLIGFVSRRRKA